MRETKKKNNFLAKKSFFVGLVVITSIMIIMVVMNLIVPKEEDVFQTNDWENVIKNSSASHERAVAANSDSLPKTTSDTEDMDTSAVETNNNDESASDNSADEFPKNEVLKFIKPVEGNIIKDFSNNELVYSETMNDWRTHQGIDFATHDGADVKAVADGTVKEVVKESMMGAYIVISHENGLSTLYANLREDSLPATDSPVKAGDVVGKIGKTADFEIADPSHLHFEVIENQVQIDPKLFLE